MAASVLLNITKSVSCNCDIRLDGGKITCQSLAGTQIATLPVNDGFKLIAMLFTRAVCSRVFKENLNSSSGIEENIVSCNGLLRVFHSTLPPNK